MNFANHVSFRDCLRLLSFLYFPSLVNPLLFLEACLLPPGRRSVSVRKRCFTTGAPAPLSVSPHFVILCRGYRPAGRDQESAECHGRPLGSGTTHPSSWPSPEVGGAGEVRWGVGAAGQGNSLPSFLLMFSMMEVATQPTPRLPSPPITNSPAVPRPSHSTSIGKRCRRRLAGAPGRAHSRSERPGGVGIGAEARSDRGPAGTGRGYRCPAHAPGVLGTEMRRKPGCG